MHEIFISKRHIRPLFYLGTETMKQMPIVTILFLAMICSIAQAAERGEIELIDGSLIYGEIVSLDQGVYTILSDSMGRLKIGESKIRAIRFPSSTGNRDTRDNIKQKPGDVGPEIQALQKSLLNDEDILTTILSLQEDPKVQEVLNDPDVMNAVLAGDVQSLMSNPKFLELLNHPKMQEILKKSAK